MNYIYKQMEEGGEGGGEDSFTINIYSLFIDTKACDRYMLSIQYYSNTNLGKQ